MSPTLVDGDQCPVDTEDRGVEAELGVCCLQ